MQGATLAILAAARRPVISAYCAVCSVAEPMCRANRAICGTQACKTSRGEVAAHLLLVVGSVVVAACSVAAAAHSVEAVVHTVEAVVHTVEAVVHSVAAVVHSVEVAAHLEAAR